MTHDRLIQAVSGVVLIGATTVAGSVLPELTETAERHVLRYTNVAVDGAPPIVALGTAIGALRGVIVDYLWIKVHLMKQEGLYYEVMADSDLITKLQPRREETVAAVSLDIADPYETFPRGLSILSPRGELWQKLQYRDDAAHRWATVEQLLTRPREARWVLPFPPVRTRQLLFVLAYEREWAHPRWSVPELRLFRRCE